MKSGRTKDGIGRTQTLTGKQTHRNTYRHRDSKMQTRRYSRPTQTHPLTQINTYRAYFSLLSSFTQIEKIPASVSVIPLATIGKFGWPRSTFNELFYMNQVNRNRLAEIRANFQKVLRITMRLISGLFSTFLRIMRLRVELCNFYKLAHK